MRKVNIDKTETFTQNHMEPEEGPPIFKSWKSLYFLVLGNLVLWISFFALFTRLFD